MAPCKLYVPHPFRIPRDKGGPYFLPRTKRLSMEDETERF